MRTLLTILLFFTIAKTQPNSVQIVKIAGNPSDSWHQFFNAGECDTVLDTCNYFYKTKSDIVCYEHSVIEHAEIIVNAKNDTIIIINKSGTERRYSLLMYRIIAILRPIF